MIRYKLYNEDLPKYMALLFQSRNDKVQEDLFKAEKEAYKTFQSRNDKVQDYEIQQTGQYDKVSIP